MDSLTDQQISELKDLGFVSHDSINRLSKLLGTSEKIQVRNNSLETLSENGFEIDNQIRIEDDFVSTNRRDEILGLLTRKQSEVVIARMEGKTRREISIERNISLQSVHQMFPRIKKRLMTRGVGNEKSAY